MFFSARARHCRAIALQKNSAARSPSQLALSQLGTDTRDRCAAARMGTSKRQKEATVPAVTATLAPDVRVTVRKELLRRVDFAIFWFTTLSASPPPPPAARASAALLPRSFRDTSLPKR